VIVNPTDPGKQGITLLSQPSPDLGGFINPSVSAHWWFAHEKKDISGGKEFIWRGLEIILEV